MKTIKAIIKHRKIPLHISSLRNSIERVNEIYAANNMEKRNIEINDDK